MRKSHGKKLKYDFNTKEVLVPKIENTVSRNDKKKGIIYTRVSSEQQKRKGGGIIGQKIDCERRATNNKVEVVKYFKDEAEKGENLSRKGFLEAIRYIEKANKKDTVIDFFICGATSRFSRAEKIDKSFDMVGRVEAAGAQLVAVGNGGIQETESEEGLISLTLSFLLDAVESKRGKKRVRYGQKGKIYSGLRPFAAVPVGYKRIIRKEGDKEVKYLVLDEHNAPILREGLELFANGVLLTKQQLFEFFQEKGLKSNSPKNKTGKLHRSILDQILDLWKLLVYNGKITYPERGITEVIEAKHPNIISSDTLHKIIYRLEKEYGITNHKKKKYDEDADEYPLKRILLCPKCNRAVTKRKSKSHTGAYHHYYGCNNKECSLHKKGLPRTKVHDAIRERLIEITPPKEAVILFEHVFGEERKELKKDSKTINKDNKKKIGMIKQEMERIEQSIDTLSNTESPNLKLIEKKQQRWSELQVEIEEIELRVEHVSYHDDEMKKVFDEAKTVITNPVALRDLGEVEIKQLLIRVCFNNKIYYKKNQGLHTPEISLLYLTLGELSQLNSCNMEMTGLEPVSESHNDKRLLS